MVTERTLYEQFEMQKNAAYKFAESDTELASDCIKTACFLAKSYYLCYRDDSLEELTILLSQKCLGKKQVDAIEGTFLFYDTHSTDNIALTEQYLGALVSWDVDFVYLTSKPMDRANVRHIREMIEHSSKGRYVEIENCSSSIALAEKITQYVQEYRPDKAFIQTTSEDVAGVMAWNAIEGVERYYIDLSDHSFWLGADVFDYYITIRSHGFNICVAHRGIPAEKVFIQAFYPILRCKPYNEIPGLDDCAIKVLTSGRMEKLYGRNEAYFKMIVRILEIPGVEVFFAGGGAFGKLTQTGYISRLVKKYGIEKKFHILGFRNDITEVVKRMDIYVGTFPIGGGLMTQVVASQEIPIVQYASKFLSSQTYEFLPRRDNRPEFVYLDDMDGLVSEVRLLADSPSYRKRRGQMFKESLINKEEFDAQLSDVVFKKKAALEPEIYDFDCTQLRENQIDVENNCLHSLARILIRSRYIKSYKPLSYIKYVLFFIAYTDKKWLLKKLLKK